MRSPVQMGPALHPCGDHDALPSRGPLDNCITFGRRDNSPTPSMRNYFNAQANLGETPKKTSLKYSPIHHSVVTKSTRKSGRLSALRPTTVHRCKLKEIVRCTWNTSSTICASLCVDRRRLRFRWHRQKHTPWKCHVSSIKKNVFSY